MSTQIPEVEHYGRSGEVDHFRIYAGLVDYIEATDRGDLRLPDQVDVPVDRPEQLLAAIGDDVLADYFLAIAMHAGRAQEAMGVAAADLTYRGTQVARLLVEEIKDRLYKHSGAERPF